MTNLQYLIFQHENELELFDSTDANFLQSFPGYGRDYKHTADDRRRAISNYEQEKAAMIANGTADQPSREYLFAIGELRNEDND